MAQLTENKVLMFGGQFDKWWVQYNDTWIYDYEANTWTEINTQNKPLPRSEMSMSQITDGKVLLYGGQIPNNDMFEKDTIIEDAWIFDIEDMNWHKIETNTSPGPLMRCGLTKIFDNQVFLYAGTYDISKVQSKETWIYDYSKNEWKRIDTQDKPSFYRDQMGITYFGQGKILIYGGFGPGGWFDDTWLFDFSLNNFKEIKTTTKPGELGMQQIINLTKDYLLMFGGHSQNSTDRTWIFDVKNMNWIEDTNLPKPAPRYFFGMAKVQQGKGVVYGGVGKALISEEYTWLYELDTNYIDVNENQNILPEIKTFINSNNELILDYYLTECGKCEIEIYNLSGFLIYKSVKLPTQIGWDREIIPVNNLPVGVYFVRVRASSLNLIGKFLVY